MLTRIFVVLALAIVSLSTPAYAAGKTYTGVWETDRTTPMTLTVSGKNARYCIEIRDKNGREKNLCLTRKFNTKINAFRFFKGKKGKEGSWGVRFEKDGSCYKGKFERVENSKVRTSYTRAC